MADDQQPQQPQQPAQPDYQAILQALIQRQLLTASGQGQQVQLPPTPQAQTQYSNDPSKGPDLLARIGLAIGGGSLPGAPAELRQQMGKQALLNFGIGLLGAGRFSTPGEALAGGLKGAQSGLLGSEAAQAGQQEYALGSREKLAELGLTQQKNQTEALASILPLLQMGGRLGLPPLFGGGAGSAGGAGGGGGLQFTGDPDKDLPMIAQRESGGDPNALNYVAKADQTAYARGATASGKYQIVNSTWSEGKQLAGIDPAKYPTAAEAPEKVQDQVARAIYAKYGSAPWDASKFGANWQQQPGGGYQLVKGAPPPATGPGSAVGPYKSQPPGAATAAAAPSGVQMGGPPPPPPGGAGGDNSGGGIGTVLNPAATGTAAAPPPAGKRAAADAILQGIQTAQATPVVRGTGQEAGPSSAVATLAQPPAAQPGWGANVGSYDFGGPVGPVTPQPPAVTPQPPAGAAAPPAVTPQPPPATQPPAVTLPDVKARNDDGSFVVPDVKTSLPQFQSRYRTPPTPDELVSRGLVLPENVQAFRDKQTAVQNAEAEAAAAHAVANRGAVGYPGFDVDKALQAANTADKNAQDARNTYNGMVQDAAKTNAGALRDFYKDQDAQLASAHKDILDRQATAAENDKNRQAELDKAKIGAGYTAVQHQIDAEKDVGNGQLTRMGEAATKAEAIQPMLTGLIQLINDPKAPEGALGQFLASHQDWLPTLTHMGLDPKTASISQLIKGLTDYMSLDLKPNATGAMRIQEIPMLQGLMPSMGTDKATQQQALARILNYTDRVKKEYDFAQENFGNPVKGADGKAVEMMPGVAKPNYKIMYKDIDAPMVLNENGERVGGGLGAVVPTPPKMVPNPSADQIEQVKRYNKYVGNLPSGMPYNTYERDPETGTYSLKMYIK